MAILNPKPRGATKGRLVAAIFLSAAVGIIFADESRNPIFAGRAEAEFHHAQTQFQSNTNEPPAAWQFARACYDFADFATNNTERAALAELGIAACRQLLMREPRSAPGHYYLGMNFGTLADAEAPSMTAYKLVHEIEREFKSAAELDEHFDFAGPARNLGELYFHAPGWPLSVGSKHKAREWLERAVKLAPNYPENHLNLIEARLKWNDRAGAQRELKTLDTLWPDAQTIFTGAAWERSWNEWSTRRDAARKKLDEPVVPSKPPKNSR
jgi:tetratricopeptide (TPR) repeat protein